MNFLTIGDVYLTLLLSVVQDGDTIVDEGPSHGVLDELRLCRSDKGPQLERENMDIQIDPWSCSGNGADHDFPRKNWENNQISLTYSQER